MEDTRQAEAEKFSSVMFDFEGKVEGQKAEPDNEDIFAAATPDNLDDEDPISTENSDRSCSASASSEGVSAATDKGDDEESMWRIAESTEVVRPMNDQATQSRPAPELKRKRINLKMQRRSASHGE